MNAKDIRRRTGWRIVALIAAYGIAVSTLIGGVATGRAAAATIAADAGTIICHTDDSEAPVPASDGGKGDICADCCCAGCLTLAAAVPPPSGALILVLRTVNQILQRQSVPALSAERETHPQQSRAPPSA